MVARTQTDRSAAAKVGDDPSTIRNPYARPKAGPGQRTRPLPEVVEMPDSDVRFALLRGEEPQGLDVIGDVVWLLVYRCIYSHGVRDEIARFSRVIARSRAEAVRTLQGLMYGFAVRIELYEAMNFKRLPEENGDSNGDSR